LFAWSNPATATAYSVPAVKGEVMPELCVEPSTVPHVVFGTEPEIRALAEQAEPSLESAGTQYR
jgi:hypothetical protein